MIQELIVPFGKYESKTLDSIFKTDKKYFIWLCSFWEDAKNFIHNYKKDLENAHSNKNKKYVIGKLGFDTKKKMKQFISTWLRYSYDGYVPDKDSSLWIHDLFKRHKRYDIKSKNIVHFVVRLSSNNFHFAVVLSDATETDFSYNKCLANVSYATEIKRAFRYAIMQQIYDFKNTNFKGICEISEQAISADMCDIDHNFDIITFEQILQKFLKQKKLDINKITLIDCGTHKTFKDTQLESDWKTFHKNNAILRCIHKDLNRQAKKSR